MTSPEGTKTQEIPLNRNPELYGEQSIRLETGKIPGLNSDYAQSVCLQGLVFEDLAEEICCEDNMRSVWGPVKASAVSHHSS